MSKLFVFPIYLYTQHTLHNFNKNHKTKEILHDLVLSQYSSEPLFWMSPSYRSLIKFSYP